MSYFKGYLFKDLKHCRADRLESKFLDWLLRCISALREILWGEDRINKTMRISLHRMCSLKEGKEDTFLSYCIQLLLSFIIHAKIMGNILWSLLKGSWLLILKIEMSQLHENLNKIKIEQDSNCNAIE